MENITISFVDGKYVARWYNHVSNCSKNTYNTITFYDGWILEGNWNSYQRGGYGKLTNHTFKKKVCLNVVWYKEGDDPYYLLTIKGIINSKLYKYRIPIDLINDILNYFGNSDKLVVPHKNVKKDNRYKRKLWIRVMTKEFKQYRHLTKRQINNLYIKGFYLKIFFFFIIKKELI